MSSASVITDFVCPAIGVIISNFMWLSPLPAVLEVRITRSIGALNPYPFAITVLNCIGWVIYGCLIQDFFVFFSNIFGLMLGTFNTIVCLTVTAKRPGDQEFSKQYLRIEGLLIFALFFWSTLGIFAANIYGNSDDERDQAALLVGYSCSAICICYYAAPCATMVGFLYCLFRS
jgi:solute carrier family 50 protein (sugar transporter)